VRIAYDTEFLEDGQTIELISIGMISDDGDEYYAVNDDAPWRRIRKHEWLMQNVVPQLPQPHGDWRNNMPHRWLCDRADAVVRPREDVARRVREFILCARRRSENGHPLELWADYAAYDHVVLAQLFGPMVDLPPGIPMFTHDFQHELSRRGLRRDDPRLPTQAAGVHHALADARHLMKCLRWLDTQDVRSEIER
jgi:hypothetical protein